MSIWREEVEIEVKFDPNDVHINMTQNVVAVE